RTLALTLAQTRGLEPQPAPALTGADWVAVEQEAARCGRGKSPCAICRESFKCSRQALLSCGHIFHAACLSSFERFTRTRNEAERCPLCRNSGYQKCTTMLGTQAWRQACAIKVQAWIRGRLARRQLRRLFRARYRGGRGDSECRRRFFASELGECASRMEKDVGIRAESLDMLFAELDAGLAFSREVFNTQRAAPACDHGIEACTPSSCRISGWQAAEASPASGIREDGKAAELEAWAVAFARARERDTLECPICMNDMCSLFAPRPVLLLSCSHVMHLACLHSFEDFGGGAGGVSPGCPVCRSTYKSTT
ncbi:unnamed protein product, partial [Phaeothamnion confervicola]